MRNRDVLDRLAVDEPWKSSERPDAFERLAMGALGLGAVVLAVTAGLEWTQHRPFDAEAMQERIRLVAEENAAHLRNPTGTCPL